MPIPLPPLIDAGAELLSSGINAVIQSGENAKNRRFANWQYDKQRADALSDYHMQNAYNSPAEQMKRLKEAGLNPNLVYGGGATATGGAVRSSSATSPNTSAPKISLGSPAASYLNAKQMQLQNDNLTAQNKVLLEQAKNIATDTAVKQFSSGLKEFDLNFKTENRNRMLYKAEQQNLNLFKQGGLTDAQIANTKARTETEVATRQPKVNQIIQSTSESVQRVLNMRIQAAKTQEEISYIQTQIQNANKDGKLKELEIELKKMGMTWQDPAWQRKALMLLKNIGL
ncbi:MAG: DNA pilot protein [Microviridae sp.]|nr:MAG: DNA pilot protein [Microviridae sp.]